MSTQLIGCNSSDRIQPLGYYRLTLSVGVLRHIMDDSNEDYHLRRVYSLIGRVSELVPSTGYGRVPGQDTIVVDCKATSAAHRTVGDTAASLDGAEFSTTLVSIEKLTSVADVQAGAAQRDHAAAAVSASHETPSLLSAAGSAIGDVGSGLKWAVIAAAILGAALLVRDFEGW